MKTHFLSALALMTVATTGFAGQDPYPVPESEAADALEIAHWRPQSCEHSIFWVLQQSEPSVQKKQGFENWNSFQGVPDKLWKSVLKNQSKMNIYLGYYCPRKMYPYAYVTEVKEGGGVFDTDRVLEIHCTDGIDFWFDMRFRFSVKDESLARVEMSHPNTFGWHRLPNPSTKCEPPAAADTRVIN